MNDQESYREQPEYLRHLPWSEIDDVARITVMIMNAAVIMAMVAMGATFI